MKKRRRRIQHQITLPIDTKLKLHLLGLSKSMSMSLLVEQLVNELWEREKDMVAKVVDEVSAKKELEKVLGQSLISNR